MTSQFASNMVFHTDAARPYKYNSGMKEYSDQFLRCPQAIFLCFTMIDPCTTTPETLADNIPCQSIQYSLLSKKRNIGLLLWHDLIFARSMQLALNFLCLARVSTGWRFNRDPFCTHCHSNKIYPKYSSNTPPFGKGFTLRYPLIRSDVENTNICPNFLCGRAPVL